MCLESRTFEFGVVSDYPFNIEFTRSDWPAILFYFCEAACSGNINYSKLLQDFKWHRYYELILRFGLFFFSPSKPRILASAFSL